MKKLRSKWWYKIGCSCFNNSEAILPENDLQSYFSVFPEVSFVVYANLRFISRFILVARLLMFGTVRAKKSLLFSIFHISSNAR